MRRRWVDIGHDYIPIRVRLTFWYVLALALALAFFALFLHIRVEPTLEEQADLAINLTAELAQYHIIVQGNQLAFEDVEQLAQLDSGLALFLLAEDNTVWDKTATANDISPVFPPKEGFVTVGQDKHGLDEWRVYSIPVPTDDPRGWLQVIQTRDVMEDLRGHIFVGLPVVLLLSGAGGVFLATRVLRPIDKITHTTQMITANDLHQRIGYAGPQDEIGRLAATLDDMLDRLEAGFERERRFTSDAAHELRTPLTALKGQIGVTLSQDRSPKAYIATLRVMEEQVDRLIHLSNDLLFLARLEHHRTTAQHEQILVADLMLALLDQVMLMAEEKHITLTGDVQPDLIFHGNMNLLIRLFLNLLDNAIKYTLEGGTVTVRACQEGSRIRISVTDSGPGIPADQFPHLFERFFRVESDRARKHSMTQTGTGLGLAIAYEIARAHNGTITVQSTPGHGSTFTVWLPTVPVQHTQLRA